MRETLHIIPVSQMKNVEFVTDVSLMRSRSVTNFTVQYVVQLFHLPTKFISLPMVSIFCL